MADAAASTMEEGTSMEPQTPKGVGASIGLRTSRRTERRTTEQRHSNFILPLIYMPSDRNSEDSAVMLRRTIRPADFDLSKNLRYEFLSKDEYVFLSRWNNFFVGFSVLYTTIIMVLARHDWAPKGCGPSECFLPSFRAMSLIDSIIGWVVSLCGLIAGGYLITMIITKVKGFQKETFWCLVLFIAQWFYFSPIINLDRWGFPHIQISGAAASALAIARYLVTAVYIQSFLLALVTRLQDLLLGSTSMARDWKFFFIPSLLLLGYNSFIGIHDRVELAPNPGITLLALANRGVTLPMAPKVNTIVSSSLLLLLLVLCILRIRNPITKVEIKTAEYEDVRKRYLSSKIFFMNTLWIFIFMGILYGVSAALFPAQLVSVFASRGEFSEEFVLNLPYYTRSNYALLAYASTMTEMYLHMPIYQTTTVEKIFQKVFPSLFQVPDASLIDEDKFKWKAQTSPAGHWLPRKKTFVLEEAMFLFNIAWMSYLQDDAIRRSVEEEGSKYGLKLRSIFREYTRDLAVVVLQSESMIVVGFRGTVSLPNWRVNIKLYQEDHVPQEDPPWLSKSWKPRGLMKSRVHAGFQQAYFSIRQQLMEDVLQALGETTTESPRIMVTGHSLGGALATLFCFDVRSSFSNISEDQVTLYTFGSPKVGNRVFAKRFNAAVPDSYRVVNKDDGVTMVPRVKVQSYEHVDTCVLLGVGGAMHIRPLYADLTMDSHSSLFPHLMGVYRDNLKQFMETSYHSSQHIFFGDFWDFDKFDEDGDMKNVEEYIKKDEIEILKDKTATVITDTTAKAAKKTKEKTAKVNDGLQRATTKSSNMISGVIQIINTEPSRSEARSEARSDA